MLKPFQIRNLQEGESEASQPVNSGLGAGVVQISAPEYDAAISEVPEATLTYLDDDDGETITVRTSNPVSVKQIAYHCLLGRIFLRTFGSP